MPPLSNPHTKQWYFICSVCSDKVYMKWFTRKENWKRHMAVMHNKVLIQFWFNSDTIGHRIKQLLFLQQSDDKQCNKAFVRPPRLVAHELTQKVRIDRKEKNDHFLSWCSTDIYWMLFRSPKWSANRSNSFSRKRERSRLVTKNTKLATLRFVSAYYFTYNVGSTLSFVNLFDSISDRFSGEKVQMQSMF